ncbi:beta-N-acetylhexosaminidase [Halosquirtibacter xylanolyticus]|uniref:beta-N-acetylhexosaminidase n=1 Tax=Halosquirtibacter xylanolyticus TaxID=3374599 RepID=UPI0037481A4E|nr:beta-N-acetylhexosaminidase [Prolixibacteraceae bacterium]
MKFFVTLIIVILCHLSGMAQNILPTPSRVEVRDDLFHLPKVWYVSYPKKAKSIVSYFTERFDSYCDVRQGKRNKSNLILSFCDDSLKYGMEGYDINIEKTKITISAYTENGLFYAIQSLIQLFPSHIQANLQYDVEDVTIPTLYIFDKPRYAWRSFMLDSGRQYQSVDFIKKYLDHMAMLKMNVFHWHLSESLGWRIEIKKYPRLAKVGAFVHDWPGQHGYYTQKEIREIVEYARKRMINVMPEIDLPGHADAMLVAYPELSCFNQPIEIQTKISSNLCCAGKETTYHILEDILDEACDLFPFEYLHLGGDEAKKDTWDRCPDCQSEIKKHDLKDSHELQQYFSKQLALYLKEKGRRVVFWQEVAEHDGVEFPDNIAINWWIGNRTKTRRTPDVGYRKALEKNIPIILNTNRYSYLNFPVVPWKKYKKNRTSDLKVIYEQNVSDIANPSPLVMGMGCSLWTDWNVQEYMIDQRVFPRIYALSEQMWHNGKRKSFDEFYECVIQKYSLLKQLGIDYGPALKSEVPKNYKWD